MGKALLVALALSQSAAAHAGWQYTRWGMTVDEARAASSGALRDNDGKDRVRGRYNWALAGDYHAVRFDFGVTAGFDVASGGLIRVVLTPRSGDACAAAVEELSAKYGAPELAEKSRFFTTRRWRDASAGNLVDFTDSHRIEGDGPGCSIAYEPLERPESGL